MLQWMTFLFNYVWNVWCFFPSRVSAHTSKVQHIIFTSPKPAQENMSSIKLGLPPIFMIRRPDGWFFSKCLNMFEQSLYSRGEVGGGKFCCFILLERWRFPPEPLAISPGKSREKSRRTGSLCNSSSEEKHHNRRRGNKGRDRLVT